MVCVGVEDCIADAVVCIGENAREEDIKVTLLV